MNPTTENKSNLPEPQTSQTEKPKTYEELCAIYGKPGRKKQSTPDLVVSLIAFFAIILMFLLTVICYTRSAIILGGDKLYGKTVNCFSYLKNVYDRIAYAFKNLDSEAVLALKFFSTVQDCFAFAITIIALLIQIIFIIIGIVQLVKKSNTLLKLLLRSIICNAYVCLVFNFICNASGGEGDTYYYVGNIAGAGMIAGIFIALIALAACTVFTTVRTRQTIRENGLLKQTVISYVNLAFLTIVLCVLTQIPVSRVLTYSINGTLGAAVSAITSNAFSFSSLAFSLMNLMIIVLAFSLFNTGIAYANSELGSLLQPVKPFVALTKKKKKQRPYTYAVLTGICLIATILLHIPQIGLGWSVNIFPYFLGLTIVSIVWSITFKVLFCKLKTDNNL